ncbi:hypothetical protein ACFSYG_16935 [Leeuwenhoekiella polynyae]|uniref:GLPGLI family protein n=1 Tax=Leeuwenhoekiella polynyae TaxID=1550906 RepID=A0A4Q0P0Y8_9FLAO|nr:hypothetical protein [Leeuwenhoekiella polynyae]RXG20180.1 hypothetical protein DSM02_2616 [Leeuwenhoekiella polynyae]
MRITLLLLFILLGSRSFSQKTYHFDYMLETNYILYKDSVKIKHRPFRTETRSQKRYLLTNSKDNSYLAILTEKDSLYYNLQFKKQDKIKANIILLKNEFDIAERINIPCKYVLSNKNHFQYQVKNYAFQKLHDTVIGSTQLHQLVLKSVKEKTIKRKKIGELYYLIDTAKLADNLPVLKNVTAYEEWKTETSSLPNGLLKETYFRDFYGYIDYKETVIGFKVVDKYIWIEEQCF